MTLYFIERVKIKNIKSVIMEYQGFIHRGGVALPPPPQKKKSEFLIIIINGSSEQNSFLLLKKNVNQSTILLLFCLKISRTSSKFTAESSGPQWQFLRADEGFSQ